MHRRPRSRRYIPQRVLAARTPPPAQRCRASLHCRSASALPARFWWAVRRPGIRRASARRDRRRSCRLTAGHTAANSFRVGPAARPFDSRHATDVRTALRALPREGRAPAAYRCRGPRFCGILKALLRAASSRSALSEPVWRLSPRRFRCRAQSTRLVALATFLSRQRCARLERCRAATLIGTHRSSSV